MLTPEYLDDKMYVNKIMQMYEKLNVDLTSSVISKLKETGDISTFTKAQLRQIAKRGGKEVFINALNTTSSLSAKRKKELTALFIEITKKDLESYKTLYDYRGEELKLSETQLKILNDAVKVTDKELKNFTKTIAFSSQQDYVKTLDEMYLQVATGGIDYNTAFRKATNTLAAKGTTLPMKNGANRSIESSVRQSINYGIRQSARNIAKDIGKQLGCDGVQINISPNCRDDHKIINGQVFSNKQWKKHSHLLEEYNCQHYETPIIMGIEENIYTKAEISEANNRTVSYKGENIPYYEATQKQRAMEREVRNAKKAYLSLPNQENKNRVLKAQKNVRNYCNATGLDRDYSREYFAGYNK